MASKQQRLYSNLSPTQKKAFAQQLAYDLKAAGLQPFTAGSLITGKGVGTKEGEVARIGQLVRIIGSDQLINDISDAKDAGGKQILVGGLRQRLIDDYSNIGGSFFGKGGRGGDLINVLNLFGYAGDEGDIRDNPMGWLEKGQRALLSPQEKEARRRNLDVSRANLGVFGRGVESRTEGGGLRAFDEMPEELGGVYKITGKEGAIPSWWGRGLPKEFPSEPYKDPVANVGASTMSYTPGTERQMFKSPAVQPTPEGTGAGEGEGKKSLQQKLQKKAQRQREKTRILQEKSAQLDAKSILNQKKRALKAQEEEAKRLENMKKRRGLLKQGYAGGVDQYDYDQQILKGTRLGDTDSEGKFRLRSPEQVEARIREGQYNLSRPMRKALQEGAQAATAARQFAEDIAPAGQSKEDRELAMQNALRQSMIGPRPAGINRKAITSPDMTGTQLRKGEDPAARDQRKWSESRGNKRIQVGGGDGGDDTPGSSVTELRDASGNVVGYSASKGVSKDQVGAASPDLADFQDKSKRGGGDFNEWRKKRKMEEDRKKTLQAEYAKKAEQNK